MKLVKKMNPKRLFKSKKSRAMSRSESSTSTDSASTPTSVLQGASTPGNKFLVEVTEAFKMMDKAGTGKITRSQMDRLLNRIRPGSEHEVSLMLTEIDANGDGAISLEEFCVISSVFEPVARADELKEVFGFFDTDKDGHISAEELLEVFKVLGDDECSLEECKRIVMEVGRSGDGYVCFEDFKNMMELRM